MNERADVALAEAEQRIARWLETESGSLDLSGLDLEALPDTLQACRLLTRLDLSFTRLRDFHGLEALTRLQVLILRGSQATKLPRLRDHVSLAYLDVGLTDIHDLSPLAGVDNLELLQLDGSAITDLAPIHGHPKLRAINLQSTEISDLRGLLSLPGVRAAAQTSDPACGVYYEDSAAAREDASLREFLIVTSAARRTLRVLDHLATLPPWPEPLPWQRSRAPAQKSALELVWTRDRFSFNTDRSSLADDPVAAATVEALVEALDDLMRLTGNSHVDLYRRAEKLRARITEDEINALTTHLAFQQLQRVFDRRHHRTQPFDDETTSTLKDIVETLPGLTLGDPRVKELLERQAENRTDRVSQAQQDAEIAIAQAAAEDGAPFTDDVKDAATAATSTDADDQLSRNRPILSWNIVVAAGREFQQVPIATSAAVGTAVASALAPWLAAHGETILATAAIWGPDVKAWITPIIARAREVSIALRGQ
ncbi:MAG: hypothetical protein AAFP13_11545 [Pseudomonadota bacterium]